MRLRLGQWAWCALAAFILMGIALPARAGEGTTQTAAECNAAGVEAYNAGKWQDALNAFSKAYELAPDNAVVRRNLCNAYQSQAGELGKVSDFAAAADLLERAIGVDPENASPLIQLGSYYLRLDLTTEAVYRLEEAVELEPDNVDGHELLGDAYYKQNDLPATLAEWEWVRDVQPNRRGLQAKMDKAYREEAVEHKYRRTESRHFRVSYAPGTDGGDLSQVLAILERAYRDIGRKFGGVYPPAPVQVIVYTADDFAKTTLLGEHIGALYDGKIRVPLRDKVGRVMPADELTRRLYHEYTHVVVRFLADANVPWWLNEGLAETFSNDLSAADAELLERVRKGGGLFPLASLEKLDLKTWTEDVLRVAYVQSHATVAYLYARFGQRTLAAMMTSLAEGMAPQEALKTNYKRTYDMLEKEVAVQGFGRVARQ